ncbi:HtaA domain-containing protein [Conexibacter sp. JD483]|uniref:HtaA domain-containing protein n=1 Tax=unclassified Conexibacter TaxID=2627773 RepID=UPI00271F467B|nr:MULTISPECIES: HtaA domain-containing protein [unclassified Conexibacter]MDO8187078.1 HtaA domain-containing protein [Conexibacter sp. CPCC 205706]MDO8200936.1 HtaA domain-containing protein [Conexibacter sp. CPCC 205762]MDR9372216.1 HtaA domain-containing protein [Conexibacter sp. JD483]
MLVALVVALLLSAAPASAAPTAITSGAGLDWGLKESWRNYIGPAGTTLSDGVTRNADGTFHFPVTGGSYEPDTGTTVVRFGGTVVFLGHCEGEGGTRPCALDLTLSNPRVEITEDGSSLYATVASRPIEGGEIRPFENLNVAALDTEDATPAVDATTTSWSGLPARMTLEGSSVFTYTVGTVLDAVSFGYDGPGGKPAGEQWADPAAPGYTRTALTAAAAAARPRWTLPLADPGKLIGIHLGPVGLSVIDRRDFSLVPGSFTSDFSGAFSSVAVDPASGTVFSGRSGANTTLRARRFDTGTSAWVEETVNDSAIVASSNVGGAAWDPTGRRYLVSRAVGSDSQLWQVRQVAGVWTASNLGSVRQTNTLPAPLLQQLAVVPDGSGGSMVVATWFGQLQRLHLTANGVVAEALAQAPGVTASKLVPTRGGLYAINADRVVWMPLGGYVWAPALGTAEPAISIPSPNGLGSLDTGFIAADYERDTLFLASHGLQQVTRIERGRLRHAFALPQLPRITYYATFLPGTTSAGDLVVTDDASASAAAFAYASTTPSFPTQPQDAHVALPAGAETADATLTVAVAGDPAPAVRWQSRVPGASAWADLSAADGVSGEQTETLTIHAGAQDGGRQYRAIATNAVGAVASARATLDVRTPPSVNVQPDSVSVLEGAPALFKAMPSGNPEPAISWQQKVGGFWREVDADSGDLTVDGGFLTVNEPSVAMSGTQFRARLRNEVGTVFTRAVTLTVAAALTQPVTFGGGHVDWGIAERWRCYVVGTVARGAIEVSGGATQVPGTLAAGTLCNGRNAGSEALRFPVRGGSYDPASGRLEVQLDGAVRFWGHDYHVPGNTTPQLDTRFSGLRVVVQDGVGTLYADAVGATMDSPTPRTYAQVALVRIELTGVSPARTAAGLAWAAAPTVLTADGAAVFGSYAAGESFDPISFDLAIGEPRRDPEPTPPPAEQPPAPQPQPPVSTPTPSAAKPAFALPKGVQRVGAARTATVATVSCPQGAACTLGAAARVKLTIGGKRYTATVLAPKRVAAGKRATVRLRLTKAAAARLAGRRANARLTLTVKSGGATTRKVVTVTLTRAKAKQAVAKRR